MQQKAVQLYIESAETGESKPVESKTVSTTSKEEKNSILSGEAEEVPGESTSRVNGNSNLAGKDERSERDDIGERRKRIVERLQQGLTSSELEVEDVSYLHAGHAGVRGSTDGETHFNVRVISKDFEGKSLVKRHRLIYDLLQEELQSGLHALSIDAKTPSEANSS